MRRCWDLMNHGLLWIALLLLGGAAGCSRREAARIIFHPGPDWLQIGVLYLALAVVGFATVFVTYVDIKQIAKCWREREWGHIIIISLLNLMLIGVCVVFVYAFLKIVG